MPLNSNALCTLAEAKDFLEIPQADTTQDVRVERLINSASASIERYCQRTFKARTITEYHDGRSTNAVLLREYPASGPVSLWVDSAWVFGADTLRPSGDAMLQEDGWLVSRGGFPRGARNVKIQYTAGYAELPADVVEAALMLVEYLYQHHADRRSGIKSKDRGDESVQYGNTIPATITDMLAMHIRCEFPSSEAVVTNR